MKPPMLLVALAPLAASGAVFVRGAARGSGAVWRNASNASAAEAPAEAPAEALSAAEAPAAAEPDETESDAGGSEEEPEEKKDPLETEAAAVKALRKKLAALENRSAELTDETAQEAVEARREVRAAAGQEAEEAAKTINVTVRGAGDEALSAIEEKVSAVTASVAEALEKVRARDTNDTFTKMEQEKGSMEQLLQGLEAGATHQANITSTRIDNATVGWAKVEASNTIGALMQTLRRNASLAESQTQAHYSTALQQLAWADQVAQNTVELLGESKAKAQAMNETVMNQTIAVANATEQLAEQVEYLAVTTKQRVKQAKQEAKRGQDLQATALATAEHAKAVAETALSQSRENGDRLRELLDQAEAATAQVAASRAGAS